MYHSTPFKKSNATRLWSIIFLLSWIFIHQVRYPLKACLFARRLMPYLLGSFHWDACRVSKLGVISRNKSCKIDRIVWEMHARWSFALSFCDWMHAWVPTARSVHRSFVRFRRNEWAVGSRAYNPQTWHSMHFPYNLINFATFPFGLHPNLLTVHTPQWNNPNK